MNVAEQVSQFFEQWNLPIDIALVLIIVVITEKTKMVAPKKVVPYIPTIISLLVLFIMQNYPGDIFSLKWIKAYLSEVFIYIAGTFLVYKMIYKPFFGKKISQ